MYMQGLVQISEKIFIYIKISYGRWLKKEVKRGLGNVKSSQYLLRQHFSFAIKISQFKSTFIATECHSFHATDNSLLILLLKSILKVMNK